MNSSRSNKGLAILAVALVITSCNDRLEAGRDDGNHISFSASIASSPLTRAEGDENFVTEDGLSVCVQPWGAPAPKTRTAFAGKPDPGTDRERINWIDGDKVRIYSPQANAVDRSASPETPEKNGLTHSYATFKVIGGTTTPEKHEGTLERDGNYTLRWSNETSYDFYGVYPPSDNFSYESTRAVLNSCSIPSQQSLTPNMSYAYMWACEEGKARNSNVSLSFHPLFTAYEISLTADDDIAAKTLTKVSLFSATDDLCGTFSAPFSSSFPKAQIENVSNNGKEVVIENVNSQLHASNPATFILFTLPTDQTNLTLSLTFSDDTILKLPLKQKNPGTEEWDWYTVPACSKVYITSKVSAAANINWDLQNIEIELVSIADHPDPEDEFWRGYQNDYNDNAGVTYQNYTGGSEALPIVWKGSIDEFVTLRVKGTVVNRDDPSDTRPATEGELKDIQWTCTGGVGASITSETATGESIEFYPGHDVSTITFTAKDPSNPEEIQDEWKCVVWTIISEMSNRYYVENDLPNGEQKWYDFVYVNKDEEKDEEIVMRFSFKRHDNTLITYDWGVLPPGCTSANWGIYTNGWQIINPSNNPEDYVITMTSSDPNVPTMFCKFLRPFTSTLTSAANIAYCVVLYGRLTRRTVPISPGGITVNPKTSD